MAGAVGFAASAYRLECRDRRLGRRGKARPFAPGGQLASRPGCRASASHVLGRVVRAARLRRTLRLPLLETFEDRHAGTSFQAANWAGETAGRGRQEHAATETPKAHLDAGWRERFSEPLAPLEVGAGLDRESWAEQEFGGAPLGGLSARLVTCAHHQGAGVHRRCEGRPRPTTVSKPDNEAVTVENILQPHRHRTLQTRREDGAVRAGQQRAELREARKKGWATRPVPGSEV